MSEEAPSPATLSLVLRTEAIRQARRWSTWGLRFGYVVAMAVLIGAAWAIQIRDPRVDGPELSRRLFVAWRFAVLWTAVGLAPVLVAVGAVEDREDGTLPLLWLTRLRPGRVVAARVVARLLALAAVVVGGVPIIAWTVAFGGVAPSEVVNATLNALVVMAMLGGLAGLLATASRRAFAPVLASLTWGWLTFFVLPSLLEYAWSSAVFLGWRSDGFVARWVHLVATWGVDLRPGTEVLSPVAGMRVAGWRGLVPVAIGLGVIAVLAGAARRVMAVAAGVLIAPSPLRWVGALGLPAGVGAWVVGLRLADPELAWAFLVGGAICLVYAGTVLYLDLALWLFGLRRARAAGAPRRVWHDPVAWREIRTTAWGGGPWRWWVAGAWAAAMVAAWWGATAGPPQPYGRILLAVGLLLAAVAGTAAVASEIAGDTLTVLRITPLGGRGLVRGKLLAVATCSLPVVAAGALLLGWSTLPWAAGAWAATAAGSVWTALWARPLRRAWTLAVGGVAVALGTAPVLGSLPGLRLLVEQGAGPLLGGGPAWPGAVLLWSLAGAFTVAASRRL